MDVHEWWVDVQQTPTLKTIDILNMQYSQQNYSHRSNEKKNGRKMLILAVKEISPLHNTVKTKRRALRCPRVAQVSVGSTTTLTLKRLSKYEARLTYTRSRRKKKKKSTKSMRSSVYS